jgi:hypothetical protein
VGADGTLRIDADRPMKRQPRQSFPSEQCTIWAPLGLLTNPCYCVLVGAELGHDAGWARMLMASCRRIDARTQVRVSLPRLHADWLAICGFS